MRFRAEALGLLESRWLRLTVSTVVSHVSLYVVLLVTLRHVGVGEPVLVLYEGNSARQVFDSPNGPVRTVIVGIIDEVTTV